MVTPNITEAAIRNLASAQSFDRGEDYFLSGLVEDLTQRGNVVSAMVEGSSYDPYKITVQLADDGSFAMADCTCPYDWGGECKHVVAVLLSLVRSPNDIAIGKPIDELLAGVSLDDLRDVFTELLSQNTHLISWVELKLGIKATPPTTASGSAPIITSPPQTPPPTVDPKPFRGHARDIMGSLYGMRASEAYWHVGNVIGQMGDLLSEAQPYINANDGRNALIILKSITEVYKDRWLDLDGSSGETGEFWSEIANIFAEATLSADLTAGERQTWASTFAEWQAEIADYGLDDQFDAAIAAAQQGWDAPSLVTAMAGNITEKGAWADEPPWYADELATIRLAVLARQGKTTEYLNLAQAEGQTAHYLTMLVTVGRAYEAIDYAFKHATTTDEALALAKALHEHNLSQDALKIAAHGLTLHGQPYALSNWLREAAMGLDNPELALKAARTSFSISPSLETYQAAERVAGSAWPVIKAELLQELANRESYRGIDIYLHENMVTEAIAIADSGQYLGFDTLRRVVDLATETHPNWAIRRATKQAEDIMDAGQSKYYPQAINWLNKAKHAYIAANRSNDWRFYLESLITKHTRKYSLRPQLESLRIH